MLGNMFMLWIMFFHNNSPKQFKISSCLVFYRESLFNNIIILCSKVSNIIAEWYTVYRPGSFPEERFGSLLWKIQFCISEVPIQFKSLPIYFLNCGKFHSSFISISSVTSFDLNSDFYLSSSLQIKCTIHRPSLQLQQQFFPVPTILFHQSGEITALFQLS